MTADEFESAVAAVVDAAVPPAGPVIAGVSGGADSVAMLLALIAAGRPVTAVHVNFNLRGDESRRDEAFVRALCRRLGVELYVENVDTTAYCARHKLGIEAGCRRIRYALFRRMMAERGCCRIAVAHNADDNAETLILNLMRGAGLRGLKGMTPDNGEILRPLLHLSRPQIEHYLKEKGESFVTDSTNLEQEFNRNFVRHSVLPMLEERWPGARRSIATSMRHLAADLSLLSHFIGKATEGDRLPYSLLCEMDAAAAASLIFHFIDARGGSTVQAAEIAATLPNPRTGARWTMPGADCVASRDAFEIVPHSESVTLPGLHAELIPFTPETARQIKTPDGNRTLWLADSPDGYALRRRRPGDRIAPLGMKGTSLVSDIVKDAHLDATATARVTVLEHRATGEIIWVPGLKRSRRRLIDLSHAPEAVWRITLDSR